MLGSPLIIFLKLSMLVPGDLSPVHLVQVTDSIAGSAALEAGDDGDLLLEGTEEWEFRKEYTSSRRVPP